MSLKDVHDRRVFDDATTDRERARVYVRPGELGLDERADVSLMTALTRSEEPQRIQVVGPSGAGKTSLILRVVGDLSRRELTPRFEVLVLRVGDRPQHLTSPDTVMKTVLETVAVEGHRFANVDPAVLEDATAEQRTRNPGQIQHQAALTTPVVSYTAVLQEAYTAFSFGQSPPRLRRDLEEVLEAVWSAGYRPVVVVDDTEKFISPGAGGAVDIASVENLFHHGVRVLGEFRVDLVIAMHPRFDSVNRVQEVIERLSMPRINVPELPAAGAQPALRVILERRLQQGRVGAGLDAVITPIAIEQLQVLYHERDCDLRSVLRVAQRAAGHAVDRDAPVIEPRDVRSAVAAYERV